MHLSRAHVLSVFLSFVAAACGSVSADPDGGGSGGSGGSTGAGGSGGSSTGAGGSAPDGGSVDGGGTVCTYGGNSYPVGSSFPSTDGCNNCSCTAGGQVACTLRACVADAGSDAQKSCSLDAVYRYGNTGGFVAYEDLVTLTPPAMYVYTREQRGSTIPNLSCAPALPPCDSLDRLDVVDILRDIAHADVQRALAAASPPTYGRDLRPVDGTIFQFLRGDGRGFLAGADCAATGTGCVAVPTGVARLVADLRALDEQQLKDPSCAQIQR